VSDGAGSGFSPNVEAWMPDRRAQVKRMGQYILAVSTLAKAVSACDAQLGPEDSVGPGARTAERVARTRVCAAMAMTGGSAIAFVSYWPDHVSIDACVCNPAALAIGEAAELRIVRHVTQVALEQGCADIRLANRYDRFFQLDGLAAGDTGNSFYEQCEFFSDSRDPPGPCDTEFRSRLYYRAFASSGS